MTGFGYDDDGTVIWQLRDNQFERLQGDYLHVHRPDHHSLGLYDKEMGAGDFLRSAILVPDAVRVQGLFLCGAAPIVTISNRSVKIGSRRLSQPRCLKDSPAGLNYVPPLTER